MTSNNSNSKNTKGKKKHNFVEAFNDAQKSWRGLAKATKIAYITLFTMLLMSLVFSFIMCFVAPEDAAQHTTKAQYQLIVSQSFGGLVVMLLPLLLRKMNLHVPVYMMIILVAFIYLSIFLGEIRNYYYRFKYWDVILHTSSGAIFTLLGFSLINLLNRSNAHMALSPMFIAIFAFCFSVSIGALWEIYEFLSDTLLGNNMQKFIPEFAPFFNGGNSHAELSGTIEEIGEFFKTPAGYKFALMDTMEDIIVDVIGALVMSVIFFFVIRRNSETFDKLVISKVTYGERVKMSNGETAEQLTIEDLVKIEEEQVKEDKKSEKSENDKK